MQHYNGMNMTTKQWLLPSRIVVETQRIASKLNRSNDACVNNDPIYGRTGETGSPKIETVALIMHPVVLLVVRV